MSEKFIFGSDFHGNLNSVDAFLREAEERQATHVIFGGDIAPKNMAVKFRDGSAIKIDGERPISVRDSEDLEKEGYMLFSFEDEKEDELALLRITQKFSGYFDNSYFEGSRDPILTLEEIVILEKYKQFFMDFLENTEEGQKIFEFFTRDLPSSLEKFVDMVYQFLKFDYYLKKGDRENLRTIRENGFYSYLSWQRVAALIKLAFSPLRKWEAIERDLSSHSLPKQREFLQKFLERIDEFRGRVSAKVSIILGNDDMKELGEDLDRAQANGLIVNATNRVVQIGDNVQMLGYSFVPPLPYSFDVWYKNEGEISKDLEVLAGEIDPEKILIANIHCPPVDTRVSRTFSGYEIGSNAVRQFVSDVEPQIVLTGHSHDHWKREDGGVFDRVGVTRVYSPGASEKRGRFIVCNIDEDDHFLVER